MSTSGRRSSRRSARNLTAATLAGILGLAVATWPVVAIEAADCDAANEQVRTGNLDVALAMFVALESETQCISAEDGSSGRQRVDRNRALSEELAQTGDERRTAGDKPGATAAYQAALLFDDANTTAIDGLAALAPTPTPTPSPTPHPMDVANALARAGLDDDAKKQLTEALKADPNATPDASLQAIVRGDFLAGVKREGELVTNALVPVLTILGLALIAWAVVRRLGIRTLVRGSSRLVLASPNDKAETKMGDNIISHIRAELALMSSEHGGRRLELATTPDDKIELPATVASKLPEAQLVADLIALLAPRTEAIGTTILSSTDRGAGLALTYTSRNGSTLDSVEIWEKNFDPDWTMPPDGKVVAAAYRRLAIAAAAWIAFVTAKERGRQQLHKVSTGWLSYALFRVGADWQLSQDLDRARQLYVRALDDDPGNDGALNNLGRLDLERPYPGAGSDPNRWKRARTRLLAAREGRHAEDESLVTYGWFGGPTVAVGADRLWFRATYNIGLAYLLEAMDHRKAAVSRDPTEPERSAYRQALRETTQVVQAASEWLLHRSDINSDLRRFMELVEQGGALMLADIIAQMKQRKIDVC